jgi:hypothetical protein
MMELVGSRQFVNIPGTATHELPPLLVRDANDPRRLSRAMEMANRIIDKEELVPSLPLDAIASETDVERRKMDLALNLVDQYINLRRCWHWGDSVIEWIRQCEITFESTSSLRPLLRHDVWPHAGRSSFVTLLGDKGLKIDGIDLEQAVGLRLTYRHLPPLADFSDQFLFYLNSRLADTAYQTWSSMSPSPVSALPPDRFSLQIISM